MCVLSSEDSASLPDKDPTALSGSGYQFFEVMCISAGNLPLLLSDKAVDVFIGDPSTQRSRAAL